MAKKKEYIPGQPSGSQGPQFENFDTAYEVDQIQKMAMESDKANLVDIDKQLAAADKELRRIKSRVAPPQGRTQTGVAKAAQYESKVIETRRFLESEREAIVKILDDKKARLPESYSSASENKNIINKSIEGPPVIKNVPKVEGPKFFPVFDTMEAVTFATSPAPAQELADVKKNKTPIGRITRELPTQKTVIADDGTKIIYDSPGSINYPEVKVGSTAEGKPITSTTPSRELLTERMDKSDMDIFKEQQEVGARYQEKINLEAITQEKFEFDYDKGEARIVGNDNFERVSTQEMFVRNSGRDNFQVVDANEANKAAADKINAEQGKSGTFKRALSRAEMTPEERRRAAANESKQKVAEARSNNAILAKQDADVRKTGNKRLITTGLDVPGVVKGAAAAKIAQAAKNLGGKTNMLNIPIMTKGSADKIFKDFFGKQDYSS